MNVVDNERAAREILHSDMAGANYEPARKKTLEEHIAIARENIRRGHNPADITPFRQEPI